MAALSSTFAALDSRSGIRRVLVAYALFGFIEFYTWFAVILWAYARSGPALAGTAAIVQLLPAALLAPAIAGIGDRIPRGTALVLAYGLVAVTGALTMAALQGGDATVVVIGASTLLTTALATIRPVHFSALPSLATSPQTLVSANALSTVLDGTARFLGPIVAGIVIAYAGYWQAFGLAAAIALVSSVLCLRLGLPTPPPDDDETGTLRAAALGLIALWRDWGSLALLLVLTIDFVVTGALDILGVTYAVDVLGRPATDASYVIGALGVGSLLGALMATSFGRRWTLSPVVIGGGLVEGLGFAAIAALGVLVPAVGLLILAGVGGAVMLVAGRTLLQRATDDRVLTRVFAVQESTTLLGTAFGAAVAPVLIEPVSARYAFVPIGVGCAVLAVLCLPLIRRLDQRAVVRPRELELLHGVPFLAVLPPYELERLAQRTRWLDVLAGTPVITQGTAGHEFYVVDTGELAVDVDGSRSWRPLTSGDGFGEIALLRDIPRTATVTALVECRLLVVDADDFLAAVTGHRDGHAIAAEVATMHIARDRANAATRRDAS